VPLSRALHPALVSDAHGLVAPLALVTPDRLKPATHLFELMTAVRAGHREKRGV
jgi:hypothetical protein